MLQAGCNSAVQGRWHCAVLTLLICCSQVTKHEAYCEKVDVFSLGCLMHELFARELRSAALLCKSPDARLLPDYALQVCMHVLVLPDQATQLASIYARVSSAAVLLQRAAPCMIMAPCGCMPQHSGAQALHAIIQQQSWC